MLEMTSSCLTKTGSALSIWFIYRSQLYEHSFYEMRPPYLSFNHGLKGKRRKLLPNLSFLAYSKKE